MFRLVFQSKKVQIKLIKQILRKCGDDEGSGGNRKQLFVARWNENYKEIEKQTNMMELNENSVDDDLNKQTTET